MSQADHGEQRSAVAAGESGDPGAVTAAGVVSSPQRTARGAPTQQATTLGESRAIASGEKPKELQVADFIRSEFDVAYYIQQLDQSERDIVDPVLHYVVEGWKRRLDPSPDFSTGFYLDRSADVRRVGTNPYYHYLRWGRTEGRLPNASAAEVAKLRLASPPDPVEAVVRSAFDHVYYIGQRPEIAENFVDPVKHYLAFGWKLGLDPAPYFSTSYYLSRSPDVQENEVNPFYHYLRWGKAEGRRPKPEGDPTVAEYGLEPVETEIERTVRPYFDEEFYCQNVPAIRANHVVPLKHYLSFGWRQGFDPAPDFSVSFYLERDAELRKSDQEPFYHYLTVGKARGRLPKNPVIGGKETNLLNSDAVRRRIEAEFDVSYYLDLYPDIKRAGLDPVAHYIHFGWKEGRDPAPWFSTECYLSSYPDIRVTEINPFYHYLVWGRQVGLAPYPEYSRNNLRVVESHARRMADDVLGSVLHAEVPLAPASREYNPQGLRIHWIVPEFHPGGGGHMTIFRMVRWLEFFGHQCLVWINNPRTGADVVQRYDTIIHHYQTIAAPVRLIQERRPPLEEADIVVATSWDTAYTATAMPNAKERFYFVQDYEPFFYPRGARAIAAEGTYERNIACVCASPWLERLMRERHGRWARRFWLAPDRDAYHPGTTARPANSIPRIAFYCRGGTARRAVELCYLAFEVLYDRDVLFQVEMYGDTQALQPVSFPSVHHGVLEAERLAELYRSCDIGICFSSTNYSLVPIEMMACGLPVIELDGESTRAVFPPDVIHMCKPGPVAIADAIEDLLRNEEKRKRLAAAAAAWIKPFSWENSAREVERAFLDKLKEDGYQAIARPAVATRSAAPKASVIIPTYNGGALFRTVLDAVQNQRAPWPFEIVVVDSGSNDGTAEFCQERRIDVFRQISKSDFQHGRTRNFAISLSSGEYAALLTQDALPSNAFWLYNFVTLLDKYPRAAGGFGRHAAHPHMSPFVRRDIDRHFKQFAEQPIAVWKYTDMQRWNENDVRWKQFLHYFSDNNACLRRSVWEKIPYPEIDYGEDQLWALQIVVAGYQKIYAPSAVVYHSHDYDEAETRERARIEAKFFKDKFGYDLAQFDYPTDLARANSNDLRWAIRNGVPKEAVARKHRLNAAKLRGYLEGGHID
jgi:glycosyltransferase involved in cell wall biosynthesis